MVNEKKLKTCPWCGAHEAYGYVERDIGRAAGMRCSKCNYFQEGKR
jgi:hypothetical protein